MCGFISELSDSRFYSNQVDALTNFLGSMEGGAARAAIVHLVEERLTNILGRLLDFLEVLRIKRIL